MTYYCCHRGWTVAAAVEMEEPRRYPILSAADVIFCCRWSAIRWLILAILTFENIE